MHDLRDDQNAINPTAERTAWSRQWQPVAPDAPRSNTELHMADGRRFTNVASVPAPDLRTVGERVAECEQAIAALWDETGSASWHMRQLLTRVETLERSMRHVEAVTHKAPNPGEQEGGE